MLDDFRPSTLTEVARQLGTDPFEVVRILVQSNQVPETLQFKSDQIEKLRQAFGKR
jgi:hypothetical protein